jgi:hypothetical protein
VKAAKAPAIHMSELLLREAAFLDFLSSLSEGVGIVSVLLLRRDHDCEMGGSRRALKPR